MTKYENYKNALTALTFHPEIMTARGSNEERVEVVFTVFTGDDMFELARLALDAYITAPAYENGSLFDDYTADLLDGLMNRAAKSYYYAKDPEAAQRNMGVNAGLKLLLHAADNHELFNEDDRVMDDEI